MIVMAVINDRLKECMSRAGMKQSDLAAKTGIAKSTISQYLTGKYVPKSENLKLMASALGVSVNYLSGYLDSEPPIRSTAYSGTVGLGTLSGDERLTLHEPHIPYLDSEFQIVLYGDEVPVAGSWKECSVTVRKQQSVENGELALIMTDNMPTLWRVYKGETNTVLVSVNPHRPPKVYSADEFYEVKIEGKVVSFTATLQ